MIFRGAISGGHFKPYNPQALKQFMERREGKRVSVDIKGRTRSNEQNSYYWAVVISILSEFTGYTPDEMHGYLKNRFLQPREVVIGEDARRVDPTTTKLSTDEFSAYVESIRQWAAMELGVSIPDPRSA